MQLGVIADDFTGATDIASFLVRNGMPTVQLNGVPTRDIPLTSEAVVISLKTRSCPAEMAVSQSLAALRWLQAQGCQQFYFKYCSTFDSTAQGNIGPVLDALLAELGETRTVISPALPVNGRTVYQGYLFVGEQLLNESGMRHHPVTPMEDAHLGRLIERQGRGKAALIAWPIVARGPEAVAAALAAVNDPAVRYVVLDALSEQDLLTQGVALQGEWISGDKPSKEVTFHRAVYLHNPACKAIVHLHSHYLTALSCLQGLDPHNCIRPFTPYVVMRVGDVPVVPYYRPGDDRIAQALAGLAPRYNAFLLANHGPVVTGSSLREATNNTEELEETARLIFTLGNREIRYLTADEVKELR